MQRNQRAFQGSGLVWGALLLVVIPLYAITVTLVLRSHIFDPKVAISSGDARALWALIGSGLAASVTLVGLLFTRSHNERTLALQAEAERTRVAASKEAESRLALETVVKGLDLIAVAEKYAPSAKIAGSLAALVHLKHPVIAMRTLGAAWSDGVIDVPSAVWLIDQVFERGSDQSRLEAAALLDNHATELCTETPGLFYWPASAEYIWPARMEFNVRLRVLRSVLSVLTSRSVDWWRNGGRAGWALSLLDEVIQHDSDPMLVGEAAMAARKILYVVSFSHIQYRSGWKPVEEVRSRVMNVSQEMVIFMLRPAQQKVTEWAGLPD